MKRLLILVGLVIVVLLVIIGAARVSGGNKPFPPIVAVPSGGGSTQFYVVDGSEAFLMKETWGTPTSFCSADRTQVLLQDYFSVVDKPRRLTLNAGRESQKFKGLPDISFSAVWSPDCHRIAFIGRTFKSMPEVYFMDADSNSTNIRQLTNDQHPKSVVAFSPNGTQIAYVESVGDDVYVVIMDLATVQKHTTFLAKGWFIASLAWSPDNRMLAVAFDSNMGTLQVTVVAIDKLGVAFILDCASDPAWSPDSQFLAYVSGCSYMDPDRELRKLKVRDGKVQQLTQNTLAEIQTQIQWTTNDRIIFLTYKISQMYESQAYDWEIHEVNADGSGGLTTFAFSNRKMISTSQKSLEKLMEEISQSISKFATKVGLPARGATP